MTVSERTMKDPLVNGSQRKCQLLPDNAYRPSLILLESDNGSTPNFRSRLFAVYRRAHLCEVSFGYFCIAALIASFTTAVYRPLLNSTSTVHRIPIATQAAINVFMAWLRSQQ